MKVEVEFLAAFRDNTWDTVVTEVEIPSDMSNENEIDGWLVGWATSNLQNPNVAMYGVYHIGDTFEEEA